MRSGWFPERGVPPVLICFFMGFSIVYPAMGDPHLWKASYMLMIYQWNMENGMEYRKEYGIWNSVNLITTSLRRHHR